MQLTAFAREFADAQPARDLLEHMVPGEGQGVFAQWVNGTKNTLAFCMQIPKDCADAQPVVPAGWRSVLDELVTNWATFEKVDHGVVLSVVRQRLAMLAAAPKPQPVEKQPICPTCGSDCNERDELIKAEREIERLQAVGKQAVPLTPEQIEAIRYGVGFGGGSYRFAEFTRAIEAAHGIVGKQ
jgi:hypothetical protein